MSNERFRALWDGHAASYDRQTLWLERRLLGSSRPWVCSRASGRVLELGIGTGLVKHAFQRCVQAASLIGGRALLVNAVDGEAAEFWKRRGFKPSRDDPVVLLRSIDDIAASLGEAGG